MAETTSITERSPAGGLLAMLGGKLGISKIRSDGELAALVEKRLPAAAIKALVRGDSTVSADALADPSIPLADLG